MWRVAWQEGQWVESGSKDTSDASEPHSDCRRYFWEPVSNGLVLLSDGGAFLREKPAVAGGRWRSLAGDTGAMELIAADWDPVGHRWIGGAQDNDVMVAPVNTTSSSVALGIIGGDGSVTAVDTKASPPRLWGATQNLGNFLDEDKPSIRDAAAREKQSDDDGERDGEGEQEEHDLAFGFWQVSQGPPTCKLSYLKS